MSELVIFHKQLGDTVLLEPVLRKLAEASGAQVELLCPRQFAPVIELMPHTRLAAGRSRWFPDRLWAYDWGGKTTRAAAITFCREKHLLIPNADWVTRLHRMVFSHVQVEPYLDRYISGYFWDHTGAGTVKTEFTPVKLELPPEEWRSQMRIEEPYMLLNPVSAWKRKSYDAEKWGDVLIGVRDLGFSRVLMTGGTDEWQREHCMQIMAAAAARSVTVTDISGKTDLKEFLYIISRAKMVLCVDGAAAHLARGFRVPCVTIFGPSYRKIWHQTDEKNLCVYAFDHSDELRPNAASIPVEAVFSAVKALLGNIVGWTPLNRIHSE